MKVLLTKNRVIKSIYVVVFLVLLLILSVLLFDIFSKENTKNIEIEYIDEQEQNNEEILKEKEQEYLIEKYNEKKLLALTFDDGPSKYTHELIDELKKRNVNVTFFLLGENAQKYTETVAFEVDTGNEIGIHSYSLNSREIIQYTSY